jgi:hypothetical protein
MWNEGPRRLAALFCVLVAGFAPCSARAEQPAAWSAAQRAEILNAANRALRTYFFTNRIGPLRAALAAHRSSLLQMGDPKAFAKALTADFYAVAHDKDLAVFYSTTTIAAPASGKMTPALRTSRARGTWESRSTFWWISARFPAESSLRTI